MRDNKSTISTIIGIIFAIYVMSVTVMATYYCWVDIKKHDSFVRGIVVSPFVGLIKATHWPYYVFLQKSSEKQIDPVMATSVNAYLSGYGYFIGSNEILKNMRSSNDIIGDLKKMKTLLETAKTRLNECDINALNQIYPGWGDNVKNNFIPGIDYYLIGLASNGDRTNLPRGDALLAKVNNWLEENWNSILLNLNEHGYEIKK